MNFATSNWTPTILQGGHTALAAELNARMSGLRGWLARRRYARIYGEPWTALPLNQAPVAPLTTARATRAQLATVR